jgi:hypothetical protein
MKWVALLSERVVRLWKLSMAVSRPFQERQPPLVLDEKIRRYVTRRAERRTG